jgi:hypothetical protein
MDPRFPDEETARLVNDLANHLFRYLRRAGYSPLWAGLVPPGLLPLTKVGGSALTYEHLCLHFGGGESLSCHCTNDE